MNSRTRLALSLMALLLVAPSTPGVASSSRPPGASALPDPARERAVRMLRARFILQEADSGLLYRINERGAGPRARPADTVTISFAARLINGANVASLSGRETIIKVAELIPGLAEAAQMFPIGTKATICVMPHLSFADGAWPKGVRAGSPILYEVEMHDISAPSN